MKLTSGLAAVALAATTLAVVAPAGAATPTDPAGARAVSAGATWLTDQLTDGIVVGEFDGFVYDDFGLSADFAFALDAVGGQDATVVAIADAVAPKVTQWYDFAPTVYTGSAAKAIALAQVAGRDARDFGGTNLQSVVEANVATSAPIAGRVQNTGETDWSTGDPTDSLNVISQSWAARALGGQDSDLADEVMSFLLEQQCDDGSFRAALTEDKAAPEQGCTAGEVGEVDTTALAVINILETPEAPLAAKGAVFVAASWLKAQQASDGSFSAGALGTNSNTTGLAGWALAAAGHDGAATKAAGWLRGLQVADLAPCATTLSAENGAVAYKAADLAAARAAGTIPVALQDGFRRASAQALPALAHVPAGGDVTASAPATAVEKSTVTVDVAGLGAGEPACVSLGGRATSVTGTGSVVPVTFALPAGAATHTFTLTTLAGTTTARTVASPSRPKPIAAKVKVDKVEKVRNNRFKVALVCADAASCAGKITVRTAAKVAVDGPTKKKVVRVSEKRYSLVAGGREQLSLKLTKTARGLVADGRLEVRAVATARGGDRVVRTFWLKSARG